MKTCRMGTVAIFASLVISPCDVLEVRVAFKRDDFGAVMNFDVGILLNALNEIAGHRV